MILRFSPGAPPNRFFGICAGSRTAPMASRGKAAPERFDAMRLVRGRGVIEGSVDAHELPRVADLLADGPASVSWRIEGIGDASDRPALRIGLHGSVTLVCQRCLADFAWPVEQSTDVLLARDEAELAALDADSSLEVVLVQGPTDPLTLVEDELVLALPFAPRHPEDDCVSTTTPRRT